MKVVVLGGTRFIGRAVVGALVGAGHVPLVCHRGRTEPENVGGVEHLHADRADLVSHRDRLVGFAPDAVVDCMALTGWDARVALAAIPDGSVKRVVLSSQDVYRAFATFQKGDLATDDVPIVEDSPLRPDRYPYPGRPGWEDYSKIDVEDAYLEAGATVLRLPMVSGPGDYQRREELVLRRVRAGRTRIPVGVSNALLPVGFVDDVARGVVAAVEHTGTGPSVYNLVNERTVPIAVWMRRVLDAAGSDAALVRVPEATPIPTDLEITGAMSQALVTSSAKARRDLGYADSDPEAAMSRTVRWHLRHPPGQTDRDFSDDDRALAALN